MDTKSTLHCKVSREVKGLLTAASVRKGERLTGSPGKLTPWVINVLVAAAIKELGFDSFEDWLANKPEANRD